MVSLPECHLRREASCDLPLCYEFLSLTVQLHALFMVCNNIFIWMATGLTTIFLTRQQTPRPDTEGLIYQTSSARYRERIVDGCMN